MKTFLAILAISSAFAAHNGTVVGSPTFPSGKFAQCIDGMTASNYITLPSGTFTFTTGASWTIEMWMRNPGSSFSIAIAFGSDTSLMTVVGENSDAAFSNGPGFGVAGTSNLNNGQFHHVAVVMSAGTSMKLFVDGVQEGSASVTFTAPDSSAGQIGRNDGGGHYWQGQLDEIAIWSTAKYTTTFTPPVAAYTGMESDLVALYHLDGDAIDSVNGGSGDAHIFGGVF